MIAWKAAMIEAGLRPKTIRDAKLAPVRAILQWALDNHRLEENPAKRVVIDVKIKPAESKRSFSDAEAAAVLGAALQEKDPVRHWEQLVCEAVSASSVPELVAVLTTEGDEVLRDWALGHRRFRPIIRR
jgi:hypothetical protein